MSASWFNTAAFLGRFGPDFRSLFCAVALLVSTGCASLRNVSYPFGVLMTSSVGIELKTSVRDLAGTRRGRGGLFE